MVALTSTAESDEILGFARQLQEKAAKSGLFVIVGNRPLAEGLSADMLHVLDDPALFVKTTSFPAYEPTHALEVYEMRAAPQ